ncbi:glycoside hydrolase family protein [Nodularia spumigena]|uniref:Glycosyl hydrolase family 32 N-terminal domain-containing protein n=1 Tax=Nodularia spumigena UHCC 0060 TaxID=3110300 RepID=A0ABU5UZY7_NODSP|nr:hypothetical protein [Nodularia spumigena]MEA5527947.1 hypothetical protein [Nodularia spumigena UHCC 0143]MEA5610630.1 hypothetical protein [Nodularia spumigena UHCC 0060]
MNNWQKKGLIYKPNNELTWAKSHAQIPTVDVINQGTLRIFFSTRDESNRSHTTYMDVGAENPKEILYLHQRPLLELGLPGTFDDCGIMPSSIVTYKGIKYLYYIGWNVRNTVPYHNAIGLAVSEDNGLTFNKLFTGPIMDRTSLEPYFCGTACVKIENGIWRNWYLSCTKWIQVNGKAEPLYNLKYAESLDGINWKREGVIAIDFKNEDEGGLARASVVKDGKIYKMWYCYRGHTDYRMSKIQSYRIGYAESLDGIVWKRMDDVNVIEPSDEGWDSEMVAYPEIVDIDNKRLMFYNGNGFGQSGFGYAEINL